MERLGSKPENIVAAIGPCLHVESFEVGDEFFTEFSAKSPDNQRFFKSGSSRYHFDNAGFIESGLNRMGITNTEILPYDTYAGENDFFSFRRATHYGEPDYGRQLSAIMLKKSK